MGGELLGQVTQKDMYLAGTDTWRIREEAGQYIFAQKSHDRGTYARIKKVSEKIIAKEEAERIMRERGVPKVEALRYAFWTFLGKFVLPVTFIVPLLLLQMPVAIVVDVAWASLLLALLSFEQAIVSQTPIWRGVLRTLGLATLIAIFARLTGLFIEKVF